jgi:hypothetical protein
MFHGGVAMSRWEANLTPVLASILVGIVAGVVVIVIPELTDISHKPGLAFLLIASLVGANFYFGYRTGHRDARREREKELVKEMLDRSAPPSAP